MPLNLSNSELDSFIKNRLLLKKFVIAATQVNADINNDIDPQLTTKEKIVYELIIDNLNTINSMLAEICVEDNANRSNATRAPYRLEWSEYEFYHVATITKSNSDFFWTISASKKSSNEFKFMHMNTNGTLNDVQIAFNETIALLNAMPTLKIERKRLVCNIP